MRSGRLAAIRVEPNPDGALDALYVLAGDAIAAPVQGIDGLDTLDHGFNDRLAHPRTVVRRLRIVHFNDLHNALLLTSAGGATRPLFSRIVRRYRAARAEAGAGEAVLLLSGGDDHTGTPFDELLGWSAGEFVADPAYLAYSAAGVDAATLGNHDLDRGGAVLAAGIAANARFPILSANVAGSTGLLLNRHYFPGAILVVKGLSIGMIGLTTPLDTRVRTAADPDLFVASPLQVLRHMLPAVAAYADIVIVMSHCGYGVDSREARPAFGAGFLAEGDVAIARLSAQLTERPVLVLGGHSHTALNVDGFGPDSSIDGVPIVQAGGQGSHVGEFDATLALRSTRAHWTFDARLYPLSGSPRGTPPDDADPEFDRLVIAPLLARVRERSEEVLAEVGSGADLSRETTLRARYCGECALVNFICDALVARSAEFPGGAAQLALVNSTAVADGLPAAGSITFGDWYRVQPFADTLQVAEIDPDVLLAILESNARRIVRPEELAGPTAVDCRGYVSRGFLHFSGALRYTLRLNGSARDASVDDVMLDGRPLAAAAVRKIRVVFTNYLGAGGYAESWNGSPIGAGVPGFLPGYDLRPIERRDTGLVFRNEVIAHLRGVGRLDRTTGAAPDGRLTVI